MGGIGRWIGERLRPLARAARPLLRDVAGERLPGLGLGRRCMGCGRPGWWFEAFADQSPQFSDWAAPVLYLCARGCCVQYAAGTLCRECYGGASLEGRLFFYQRFVERYRSELTAVLMEHVELALRTDAGLSDEVTEWPCRQRRPCGGVG